MRVLPRRLPKSMVAVAVGLTVAGSVLTVPAAAAPAGGGPAVPALTWQPCGPQFPGFECATATVPLDYDQPRGATTSIALARKPATNTANRIGSLFINPGGPGGSGVNFALSAGNQLSGLLDGRFDIVGFDPRGIGRSAPLHCFTSVEERDAFFAGVPGFPYQDRQLRPYFDRFASLGGTCRRNDGTITRHMSTADVVRDLDLLRRAVGDRKLNFLGFSYGSYIGNTYANLFPNNIRAMVIDGVLDPRLWSSGWQVRSDRVATLAEFNELLRLCDEAGPACAFATPEGSAARWEKVAEAVLARPVDLGGANLYTYDRLIGDATSAMSVPEAWGGENGYVAFLDQIADAALGGGQAAAGAAERRRALVSRLAPEPDYPNFFDAYNGNACADIEYPSSFAAFRAIDRYARAGSRFGPLWWWGNAGCADWPVNQDRYAGPWRTRTSAPVLVVGNHFDGVTDFAGAQASARLLVGSRLLAYAGWGHTAYSRSACATEHVNRYLLTGALPAEGTVCPANPNPFLTSALAASAPIAGLPGVWPAR